jgi:signal transduction histidine kinase
MNAVFCFGETAMQLNQFEGTEPEPERSEPHSERHLEALVYALSHDLRAPLRAIDGFSRALEQDMNEGSMIAAKRDLQEIQLGVARMHGIINKWMSMINGMSTSLRREYVDLSVMARSVFKDLQIAEPYRRVTLNVSNGVVACGDEVLLRELLQNLIGNAWKFSASRADKATIEVGRTQNGKAYFVRDNGIGITAEDAERIFEPFYRVAGARSIEGSGMGLAIVRHIVEIHGGMVWADGHVGLGTTVYFTLPDNHGAHIDDIGTTRIR